MANDKETKKSLSGQEKERLPSTLARSPEKAQRTFIETLESAEESYDGDEARAHRTAYASVKHSFERVGDHWEAKEQRGPSDEQAARGGDRARRQPQPTAQGVDASAPKSHLSDLARRLDIPGRSKMNKEELVQAIEKANRKATASARQQ